jgi:formylglycine-generating enzyme required for sulfatase activity/serine/threonine protein kinase
MPRDDDESLGDQQTYEGGAQPADSSDRSLGDQSTFGGGGESSLSDIGGLTGDADLDMEIVDLSRYEVQETLGKGGMGEVLLATDTRLNRKVAIKRMLGDAAKSQTAVKRFLTEAQSIAALNHFNIVQIHDYGRDKDGPFLIMEYVGGGSLLDKCREGALPLEEAVELTCQLCDGLSKAHDAGIIHRDIKPANILLTTDGLPKLTDFGLARQDTGDTGQTMAGAVLGTLDFMPPEQRRDATLTDARSDLWSLAATLYQMMTGKSPKVIKLNDVPQSLQDVLGKALEDEQDDRYQTAREFKDALRAAQQGVGTETLEEGSCPGCGTKNPTNRKFCRNEDCGIDLQVACLSCSEKMPMWEGVCDSCGTKQSALLEERRDSMVSSQSAAESLMKVYDFDRATALATALRDEPDPRLQHLKGWAEKFLPQIEQERQQQLERISEQFKEAAAHEQAHDYAAGLRVLEKVPAILREAQVSGHSDTVSGVMSRLQSTLDEIKRLDGEIRQRVEARKLNGLLSQVNQLLELQPDRRGIQDLKTKLEAREEKVTAKVTAGLAKARSLRQACRFESAITLLEKMPEDLGTLSSEINDLKHDCGRLAALHEVAMRAVEAASAEEMPVTLITGYESDISGYQNALTAESLEDPKFLSVCDAAALKLSKLRGANEQKLKIRLAIAGAAGVFLIAVGLWVNSFLSSRPLANAIEGQQWDEALAIDDQHVPALLGRANQRLNAGTPDIEGAFADIGLAEQVDSTVAEIKPAKALAHAKRAASLATDGKIADAEKDLKEAETLGALDSQLTSVRQLLAVAYVKQAEDAVQSGNASQVLASASKAVEYDESTVIPPAVLQVFADESVKQFEQSSSDANQTAAIAAWRSVSQLDATAALTVELRDRLITLLSRPVVAFEQAPTVENQTTALAALTTIQSVDATNEELPVLRKRVTAAVLKRGESVADKAPDSALKDYEKALSLGASVTDSASLKTKLVTALTARCRQSLGSQDVAKASADYAVVAKLDSQAVSSLVVDLEKLPASVLSQLPASVLSQLPASVLSQLPPRKNTIGMAFKLLPGGTFTMGDGNEAHQVTLTQPFELGVYEVTQEQYEAVMGTIPSKFKGLQNPVQTVSWNDAVEFCRKLSELPAEKKAGYVYRLPTEAEWEYACRAGTTTTYSFGDSDSELGEYAWYRDNSGNTTHPVGKKKPNAWGLYDMHGNVFEWCQDWYGNYPSGSVTDPTGAASGRGRVLRGGSFDFQTSLVRSAYRDYVLPGFRLYTVGFRPARTYNLSR